MIVPFAAGGGADAVGRVVVEHIRGLIGQPIIIENLVGADGSIGVGRAALARPDGYTIVLGILDTHVLNGASQWFGLFAPRRTPRNIIDKLNTAAVEVMADPAVRSRLGDLGMEIFPRERQTPETLAALVKAGAEKWWPIIKEFGIKANPAPPPPRRPLIRDSSGHERRIRANAPAGGRPQTADPAGGQGGFRLGPEAAVPLRPRGAAMDSRNRRFETRKGGFTRLHIALLAQLSQLAP
jgi:hypothetical protein